MHRILFLHKRSLQTDKLITAWPLQKKYKALWDLRNLHQQSCIRNGHIYNISEEKGKLRVILWVNRL